MDRVLFYTLFRYTPGIKYMSKIKEESILSSKFPYKTDLLNTIITADVNIHLPLLYSPNKDHRG